MSRMSRRWPLAESLMAAGIVGCCLTPWITVGWLRFAVALLGLVVIRDTWAIHWHAKAHAEQVAGLARRLETYRGAADRQVRP